MLVLKVKVISLPYIFEVLYVLCFIMPRYQVSVYRAIGPLVFKYKADMYFNLFSGFDERLSRRSRHCLVYWTKPISTGHTHQVRFKLSFLLENILVHWKL